MKRLLIWVIFLLAFVLRITDLANHPAGFTPDEASFGYDAYSVLKTGKDQWGQFLPLSFRSFGDFKLPLYVYLTVPSVAVFGLTEFAVRLPNALLGSLAVLVVYYFVLELFREKKTTIDSYKLALLSSLLLAVSPWHIPMSRGAFEANLTTLLLPLGVLLFLKGQRKPVLMLLSGVVLGLNLFSYHSARFVTPILVLALLWVGRNALLAKKRVGTIFAITFLFFILLTVYSLITGGANRVATSGIFNPTGGWGSVADARYAAVLQGIPDLLARIFNNKISYLVGNFFGNFLSYFSFHFLFTQGPGEGTYGMVPGVGLLYGFEIVFIIGLVAAIFAGRAKSIGFILFWILVSAIPAALAKGPGYAANRAAIMMPAIQITSAFGALYLFEALKPQLNLRLKFNKLLFSSVGFIIFLFSFAFFVEDYFVQQPAKEGSAMLYGVREVINFVLANSDKYESVVISRKLSEPHIYVAFYGKVDPLVVQRESKDWLRYEKEKLGWVDQLPEYKLQKYQFRYINSEDFNPATMIVGRQEEIPEATKKQRIFRYINGATSYVVVAP